MAAEAARRERPACMHACTQRGPRCRVPTPACLLLLACLLTLLQPNGVACMRAQRAMRRGGLEGAAQRIDAAAAPPSSSPSIFTQSAPLHAAAAERLRLPQTQSAAAAVPSPMPNACKPLLTGYAPVGLPALNYSMYYAYWEAQQPVGKRAPVLLWLQGGPGCASTFGAFYELGPCSVTDAGKLVSNPGSWAQSAGLLVIDQPLGTGLSFAPPEATPSDELGMAAHLYDALVHVFTAHAAHLGGRPLFITGESYAGKYVPSIAHWVLQAEDQARAQRARGAAGMEAAAAAAAVGRGAKQGGEALDRGTAAAAAEPGVNVAAAVSEGAASAAAAAADAAAAAKAPNTLADVRAATANAAAAGRAGACGGAPAAAAVAAPSMRAKQLQVWRQAPARLPPPPFTLAGIAIGNGLTDPREQVPEMGPAAAYMGIASPAARKEIDVRAADVVAAIDACEWAAAHTKREALVEWIETELGVATVFDVRRRNAYDAEGVVDALLNTAGARAAMGAPQGGTYTSCSSVVGKIMANDTMQSVKHLFPDLLANLPVLLYQGQYDMMDGVASSTAWEASLDWPHAAAFANARGELWHTPGGDERGSQGGRSEGGASEGGGASRGGDAGEVGGWRRSAGNLTHAVIYHAGHMVPHDAPHAMRAVLYQWVWGQLPAQA